MARYVAAQEDMQSICHSLLSRIVSEAHMEML